ncbi:DEAD/DEAH box helicase [Pseudomonas sp. R3-52-08]|uniref:DEAD/DEAH box helicase n=1 Tax=Pseudomonas sp. R3-52-08 TaxID=1173284 RepID=UPI000F5863C1|nr:DEAD/DEAH box helicase [Pseudomonas sp. R3-52-08]AZF20332.1 DNA/RNA helicase, SNF2 family [Pseudomonas sp. R3-52-08]
MNDLIARIVELDWQAYFEPRSLERGFEYAGENRLEIKEFGHHRLIAHCRGSGRNVYTLSITLESAASRRPGIICVCSCPVAINCKHAAAVLFTLTVLYEELNEPKKPVGDRLSPQLENWLESIPKPTPPGEAQPKNTGTCLLYQITPDVYSSGWSLEVYRARVTKQGEYSDIKPLHSMDEVLRRAPGYMHELDTRIGRLLMLGRSYGSYGSSFQLAGETGAEILQLALKTQRLFLELGAGLALNRGPARAARFDWAVLPDGNYIPCWISDGRELDDVLPLKPLHYLDLDNMEIGVLEHGLDENLALHLCGLPMIPAEQVALFSHRISAVSKVIPPPRELTERVVDTLEPQGCLTLGSDEAYVYGRFHREHRAALAFRYDTSLASGKGTEDILFLNGTETQRIQRKPAAEKALRKALTKIGFKAVNRKSRALPENAGEMFDLPTDEAWLGFVESDVAVLREAGWDVVIQPGFYYDVDAVDHWYADIEEASGHEWFNLELGVEVNGERHSLLPIMLDLMRNQPELLDVAYMAERDDDERVLVSLGARTHTKVALPYGRIKPLMATLGELYLRAPQGDALRLSAPDAARLSHLDAMPLVWRGGERLRDFAQRLKGSTHAQVSAPEGLKAELRGYQLEGLNWMQTLRELEVGGILGDDMGLGKTLQTLAHLLLEKQAGRLQMPALAVMPTSLIPNWIDEAARFTPQLRVLALHGAQRQADFTRLTDYDLVLTTYALLPRDLEVLQPQRWSVLILDEAQNIKNPNSKAAQAARQLDAGQRLCLSGTPLENHLGELWSLFHFLLPGWLGDSKTFNRDYRTPIEKRGNAQRMQHLTARIKPFLLRRKKEQVATELPPKTEIVHWVDLSDAQRDVYETVRVAMDKKVRDEITRHGVARSQIIILEALLKLRQVCCDLRLVKTAPASKLARAGTGKLGSLMEMLEELLSEARRVLLFSQFTSMLALIEEELKQRQVDYSILTGETLDRRTPVKNFQDGKTPLFLISLKAGGTGLNLTAADTVIHYDPWWNPAVENQATDRAYRIGQDKPVFVYKMIARGTVEEKIQALQLEKAALADGVLEGGASAGWKLEQRDIEALFAPLPG